MRDVVDVVILEVPSFLSVHHGQGLAPLADLVLVVGERRLTTTDELRRTSAVLKRLGAPVVGMALTTGAPVRDDDEEWDDDEDDEDDDRRELTRGRWRARKRPNDEVDDDGADERARGRHRPTPQRPPMRSRSSPTLVDQTPLSLATPSEHRAVWDVPPRPEA